MIAIKSVAHFGVPVSDTARSTRFYADIVGCRHLATVPRTATPGLPRRRRHLPDPGKARPADQPGADGHGGVHHSFAVAHEDYPAALDHLRDSGVAITYEEDRQGGVVNGPRAYFRDPDGTVLEFIDLTSYAGNRP